MGKPEPYPLVSVVIPTYNRALLLQKAMQSVLAQDEEDLELIVVDDGSTDNTPACVSACDDRRIRYIRIHHTGHIGVVRNTGAFAARGQWIAFLDSDDTWMPDKLGRQLRALEAGGRRWSYSGYRHVDAQGHVVAPRAGTFRAASGHITAQLLKHEIAAIICTLVVERRLFYTTGGFSTDARLTLRGDYEFVLRLSLQAEAEAVPEPLVDVLDHEERITRSVRDPFTRSMVPYLVFLETQQDPRLREIARDQIHRLIREQQHATKKSPLSYAVRSLADVFTRSPFKTVKLP